MKVGKISKMAVVRKFKIPKSTLSGILKDSETLPSALNNGDFLARCKRMQMVVHKDMENVLLTWIQRAQKSAVGHW